MEQRQRRHIESDVHRLSSDPDRGDDLGAHHDLPGGIEVRADLDDDAAVVPPGVLERECVIAEPDGVEPSRFEVRSSPERRPEILELVVGTDTELQDSCPARRVDATMCSGTHFVDRWKGLGIRVGRQVGRYDLR